MKKLNLFPKAALRLMLIFLFFIHTPVHATIDVNPTTHNFGEVEVGSYASTIISVTNIFFGPIGINNIDISENTDFSVVNVIPQDLPYELVAGATLDIEVTFAPSAEGSASAILTVSYANGESGTVYVDLQGTGIVAQPPPHPTIREIILSFIRRLWRWFHCDFDD